MQYSDWITYVCTLLEYQVLNPASATPTGTVFDGVIPAAIDYTENRLQRDLDFLATMATDDTGVMTPNFRLLTLPTDIGEFIVVQQITPIIGGLPNGIRQQPLEPVTRAFMDYAWPSKISPGANILPVQWSPYDQAHVLVGPAPDQAYSFEVVGTVRFPQLSAANTSNFLTLQLPDLYVAASMIFFSLYQRDFVGIAGQQGSAPSWEAQYGELLKSAQVEEARKRFMNLSPSPTKPTQLTDQAPPGS